MKNRTKIRWADSTWNKDQTHPLDTTAARREAVETVARRMNASRPKSWGWGALSERTRQLYRDMAQWHLNEVTPIRERTIDALAAAVHTQAAAKGWHNFEESEGQFITRAVANLHSEVSELFEAYKQGRLREPCDKAEAMVPLGLPVLTCAEEEYADIIIRALDNARRLQIDIWHAVKTKHRFNASRPYRHGGKLA